MTNEYQPILPGFSGSLPPVYFFFAAKSSAPSVSPICSLGIGPGRGTWGRAVPLAIEQPLSTGLPTEEVQVYAVSAALLEDPVRY